MRENVFNLVAPWVEGADVLDLFAGSGAMGLEALSRGAARVTFVEADADARRAIGINLDKLKLTGAEVVGREVARALEHEARTFDLVFCDPPYEDFDRVEPVLARHLPRLLAPGGVAVLETASRRAEPELPLTLRTSRRYGTARITLFEP